jgi:hypothetical protein
MILNIGNAPLVSRRVKIYKASLESKGFAPALSTGTSRNTSGMSISLRLLNIPLPMRAQFKVGICTYCGQLPIDSIRLQGHEQFPFPSDPKPG